MADTIDLGTVNGNDSSTGVDVRNKNLQGATVICTGGGNGAAAVEISLDNTNWFGAVEGQYVTTSAGNHKALSIEDGEVMILASDADYIRFTTTGNTGNLQVLVHVLPGH